MPPKETVPSPKKPLNIELLLGLSATFLSLAALIVSIFQTKIARDQQHASVWPYLQINSNHLNNDFVLVLKNNGVGPGLIKRVEFQYQGTREASHIRLLNHIVNTEIPQDSVKKLARFWNELVPGNIIKAGDEIEIYQTLKNEYAANFMEEVISDTTFQFRIIYSDVYGNCWEMDRNKVTELPNCPD
jgi:hypothetical protein